MRENGEDKEFRYTADDVYHKTSTAVIYWKCLFLILDFKFFTALVVFFGFVASAGRALLVVGLGVTLGEFHSSSMTLQEKGVSSLIIFLLCAVAFGASYFARITSYDLLRNLQVSIVEKALSLMTRSKVVVEPGQQKLELMLLVRQDVRAIRTICLNIVNVFLNVINVLGVGFGLLFISPFISMFLPIILLIFVGLILALNRSIVTESLRVRNHIVNNAGTTGLFLRLLPKLHRFENSMVGINMVTSMLHERFLMRRRLTQLQGLTILLGSMATPMGICFAIFGLSIIETTGFVVQQIVPVAMALFLIQGAMSTVLGAVMKNYEMAPTARHYFNNLAIWENRLSEETDYVEEQSKALASDEFEKIVFDQLWLEHEKLQFTGWDLNLEKGTTYALLTRLDVTFDRVIDLLNTSISPAKGNISIIQDGNQVPLTEPISLLKVESDSEFLPLTIDENVKLARAGATDKEVQEAVTLAGLDEQFNSLKTRLAIRELNFTKDQNLRLSIARIIVARPAAVVLDAATFNFLESITFGEAVAAIRKANPACIIIFKPLHSSQISHADKLVLFKRNDIMCSGEAAKFISNTPHEFYLNPDEEVYKWQSQPDRSLWFSFERAYFAFSAYCQRIDEKYESTPKGTNVSVSSNEDFLMDDEDMFITDNI